MQSAPAFKTQIEAQKYFSGMYGDSVRLSEIVFCIDANSWTHSDDVASCLGCGGKFLDHSNLDDHNCAICAVEAEHEAKDERRLRSRYLSSVL